MDKNIFGDLDSLPGEDQERMSPMIDQFQVRDRMAGSSKEKNVNASEMEKFNLQEKESPQNEQLARYLRQEFTKAVHKIKVEEKYSANVSSNKVSASIQGPNNDDDSPLTNEKIKKGRKIKNHVVAEKVVCFSLPAEICAYGNIKDIEKVQERLGKWRIQRRQRETKITDTYFYHPSTGKSCRSIIDVEKYIMCKTELKATQKINKDENKIFESLSKKVKPNKKPENAKGMQTQNTTDGVEALTMTKASKENPQYKESVDVGIVLEEKGRTSDHLHENFGQEFQTLEDADDVLKANAQDDTNTAR